MTLGKKITNDTPEGLKARTAAQRYRDRHPDRVKVSRKKYKKTLRYARRAVYMKELTQHGANARGVKNTLTTAWFEEKLAAGHCEMSGLPFELSSFRGPLTPSTDRIDPQGPYSPENCRVIIWWLNRALSNNGEDFAIDVFKRVIERRNG